jgi:hypothetical protein
MSADTAYWYVDIYKPFFVKKKADDGSVFLVSQRPRSRRSSFPKRKLPQTTRVFVLGGSVAAQYDSDEQRSHDWTLRRVLETAFPGKRFEVIHCGMGGYDIYREDLIFQEILRYEPDIVVLLSGNNEVTPVSGPPPQIVRYFPSVLKLRSPRKDAFLDGGPLQVDLMVDRFDKNLVVSRNRT